MYDGESVAVDEKERKLKKETKDEQANPLPCRKLVADKFQNARNPSAGPSSSIEARERHLLTRKQK